MELYSSTASLLAKALTEKYSSSFSSASTLFSAEIKGHIYNIYGLVRIADEIVDTYTGTDQAQLLTDLETETYAAIKRGFSVNPIVHAFAETARQFGIEKQIIHPFFESMRFDLTPHTYTTKTLQEYIYGSAEVVGLMCLRVFCKGDVEAYEKLAPGAKRLGAAYQKVNFLRDVADDYNRLNRYYFVGSTFEALDEAGKRMIIADIQADFLAAKPYVMDLPASARRAVLLSYRYYNALLTKLEQTPVEALKRERISLPKAQKASLLMAVKLKGSRA